MVSVGSSRQFPNSDSDSPVPEQVVSLWRRFVQSWRDSYWVKLALFGSGAFIVAYAATASQRITGTNPLSTASITPPSASLESITTAVHKGIVWIPCSEFLMGSNSKTDWLDEQPAHLVSVDGLWIDTQEVTNSQVRRVCESHRRCHHSRENSHSVVRTGPLYSS
jgi:formylglycine-generating enzyme required for sulfatase activity